MDALRSDDEGTALRGRKKLLAVIAYSFDTDGGGSPADACRACKSFRRSDEESTGIPCADEWIDEEDKPCRDSGYSQTCIRPAPEMLPAVQNLWSLWWRTSKGGFVNYVSGMSVIPVGKNRDAVITEAKAMNIPWDDLNARWYGMIEDAWLAEEAHKRDRERR